MTATQRSVSEARLLRIMEHGEGDRTVVACGIVEVRAAQRLVQEGIAEEVSESTTSVDRWGAGSMKIKLKS